MDTFTLEEGKKKVLQGTVHSKKKKPVTLQNMLFLLRVFVRFLVQISKNSYFQTTKHIVLFKELICQNEASFSLNQAK